MMLDLPGQLFSRRPRKIIFSLGPLTTKVLLTYVVWVKKRGLAWHFTLKYPLTTCKIHGIICIFCQLLTLLFVTFSNFSCRIQHFPTSCLFSLTSGQDLVSSLIICLQPEQRSNQIWGQALTISRRDILYGLQILGSCIWDINEAKVFSFS